MRMRLVARPRPPRSPSRPTPGESSCRHGSRRSGAARRARARRRAGGQRPRRRPHRRRAARRRRPDRSLRPGATTSCWPARSPGARCRRRASRCSTPPSPSACSLAADRPRAAAPRRRRAAQPQRAARDRLPAAARGPARAAALAPGRPLGEGRARRHPSAAAAHPPAAGPAGRRRAPVGLARAGAAVARAGLVTGHGDEWHLHGTARGAPRADDRTAARSGRAARSPPPRAAGIGADARPRRASDRARTTPSASSCTCSG